MTATATLGRAVARRTAGRLPRWHYAAAAIAPFLVLALWGAVLLPRPAPTLARIGQPAPAFVLADLDGHRLSLGDLRGRPVIVNFWASSCAPCIDEFPLLTSAAAAHRADGLAVVGVVVRDSSVAAREFLARMGATWPSAMDPGDAVAMQYGIIGPPDSFFIDRNGVVVSRQIGPLSAADLERRLAGILGEE
ncbi:MAG: TlpA family protein disulfide reductase [Chloroflexota bacterium]|nr:TlpA family protein disulfide reductase [Chloroflexota bacterium]